MLMRVNRRSALGLLSVAPFAPGLARAAPLRSVHAQGNPIAPGLGMCDPHVRVYDGQVYLYATHDAARDAPTWTMYDWWVWRTTDLVNWDEVSVLKPEDTYWRRPSTQCWATDAASRHGKYYLYFSRGPEEIGVVVGDTPAGPWRDPLGKALIAKGQVRTESRDPGIFQEPDGTSYIIFGTQDYYIARLNDDMISLAETPRLVEVEHPVGPYGPGKDDKPYLHTRNGKYYLSWGCYYAMSDNVYGPYVYKGCLIEPRLVDPAFKHMPPGKGYDALTLDRHASFFTLHGQWYFACNDQGSPWNTMYFRDTVLTYLHYRDNGEMAPVRLDRTGVGQYDATQPIQAADYFRAEGAEVRECADRGFAVDVKRGGLLAYPKIRKLRADTTLTITAAAGGGDQLLEVRRRDRKGPVVGRAQLPPAGNGASYSHVRMKLAGLGPVEDLCITVRGGVRPVRIRSLTFS